MKFVHTCQKVRRGCLLRHAPICGRFRSLPDLNRHLFRVATNGSRVSHSRQGVSPQVSLNTALLSSLSVNNSTPETSILSCQSVTKASGKWTIWELNSSDFLFAKQVTTPCSPIAQFWEPPKWLPLLLSLLNIFKREAVNTSQKEELARCFWSTANSRPSDWPPVLQFATAYSLPYNGRSYPNHVLLTSILSSEGSSGRQTRTAISRIWVWSGSFPVIPRY